MYESVHLQVCSVSLHGTVLFKRKDSIRGRVQTGSQAHAIFYPASTGSSSADGKLSINFHLALRLTKRGAIPPLSTFFRGIVLN
jgi:hypothetical protein